MSEYEFPTLRVLSVLLERGFAESDENSDDMGYENGGNIW